MNTDAIVAAPIYASNPIAGTAPIPQQQNIEVFQNETMASMTDEMNYTPTSTAMSEQDYQNYYEELANEFCVDETKFNIFSTCFASV
ncbi:hypothetical protein IJE86_10055 [bacterium]|nr:hypothetical protein [bacterium]